MSDRMTAIELRHKPNSSLADYGRKTRSEMIVMVRSYAKRQKDEAEAILNASDDDFLVQTYIGVHAMRNITEVTDE